MDVRKLRRLIQPRIDAGDSDQQILNWLKEPVTVWVETEAKEFLLWLASFNGIERLEVAEAHVDTDVRNAAKLALKLATPNTQIDFADSRIRNDMLRPLFDAGVFSAAERSDLLGRAQTQPPRFEAEHFRATDDASWLYWIAEARAL